ncbi:hypothetical protein F4703DRAFT_1798402 [Phycomyces blakesleeanus]
MAQLQGFIFGVWRFLQHRFIIIVFLLSSRFISGTFYISANLQLLIHSYRDGVEWCSVIGTTLRRKERSNVFSVLFIGKARNASASTPRIAKVTIVGVLLALSGISPESNLKTIPKEVAIILGAVAKYAVRIASLKYPCLSLWQPIFSKICVIL